MDETRTTRKAYPSDVSEEEWAFVAPYLTLMREDAEQRKYELREVFNGLRWMVRAGAAWRMLPTNLPPWELVGHLPRPSPFAHIWSAAVAMATMVASDPLVYQQSQRWIAAGCFEAMVHDLREILRLAVGREPAPTAIILDSRTLQSTPESGGRAGYDGAKKRKGSKVHLAVDTLGELLTLHVTPANEQDRAQVAALAEASQEITGGTVEVAFADQGYTGDQPAADAEAQDVRLEVVKHTEAKRGFVLLPRRWVVERSFGWMARFRRLARDYERLPESLAGLHFVAFSCLMLQRFVLTVSASS